MEPIRTTAAEVQTAGPDLGRRVPRGQPVHVVYIYAARRPGEELYGGARTPAAEGGTGCGRGVVV